jgi:hypothetical protein
MGKHSVCLHLLQTDTGMRFSPTLVCFPNADHSLMKRDLPFELQTERHDEPPRSMLASRTFWLGGLLCFVVWAALALLVRVL